MARRDATGVLSLYVVLLLVLPSALVVGALGTAGSPATLVSVASFLWWVWYHLQRTRSESGTYLPIRVATLSFLGAVALSYTFAMAGPIPFAERTPADSGLLRVLGWTGIILVAAEGVRSMERLRRLLALLVGLVGLLALFGLVQFVSGKAWVDLISVPGLQSRNDAYVLVGRAGFARLSGTSVHPIEYGSLLTITLPLAATFALFAPRRRWLFQLGFLAMLVAIILSISRSAVVCAGVGMLILACSWPLAIKVRAAATMLVVGAAVYVSVPGLLGTITRLFTGAGDDSSIRSRTDSYAVAFQFVEHHPLIGRGLGTFLPDYWILDNQYLGVLIETGAIGLVSLLAIVVTALYAGTRGVRYAADDFSRTLGRALVASVAAGSVALAFFDGFAFLQSSGCLFLMIGLCGAYLRLGRTTTEPRADAMPGSRA